MTKVITYTAEIRTPLIISTQGGDPFSADTLTYIPGTAVRGALVQRYLSGRPGKDYALDPEFRTLFLSDGVRFLNALPQDDKGGRMIPTPLSLRREKNRESPVYDISAEGHEEVYFDKDDFPRQLSFLGADFVSMRTSSLITYSPSVTVRFHHRRDRNRKKGRPVTGDIFTYASLDQGQRFVGHILVDDVAEENVADHLVKLLSGINLEGDLRMGRSRRIQYGGSLKLDIAPPSDSESWREVPIKTKGEGITANTTCATRLVVTLLSDYIDESLLSSTPVDGLLAALKEGGLKFGGLDRSFIQLKIIGGYPAVWHLSLPQAMGLRAGSVVILALDTSSIDPEILKKIEWDGVGGRKNEGFGRVAFNIHGGTRLEYHISSVLEHGVVTPSGPETIPAHPLVNQMEKRIIEEALDQAILIELDDKMKFAEYHDLPKSLIGRLRTEVRTSRFRKNTDNIKSFLNQSLKKPAETRLRKVKVGDRKLQTWIEEILENAGPNGDAGVWSFLKARDLCSTHYLVSPASAMLHLDDTSLTSEYQCKVIDACLALIADTKRG